SNIIGGIGADTLIGDTGLNTIDGGDGDDLLIGGDGSDSLIGGSGSDTVSYALDSSLVNVNLRTGTGTDSSGGTDSYNSIENIVGSDYDDTIEGDSGDNTLKGGTGTDTLTYENATGGVTVNLANSVNNTGSDGTDTISGFENLTGSDHDDILTGDTGINTIHGEDGDDTITGGADSDILYGDAGNDTFKVLLGDGDDTIDGYTDGVTIDIDDASNKDTIDYSGITDTTYHAEVDLSQTSPSGIVTDGSTVEQTDTLINIENVIGSSGDDTITGGSETNILEGSDGDDTFIFQDGMTSGDSIIGGSHTILNDGTQGTTDAYTGKGDTVDYSNLSDKVVLTMAEGTGTTNVTVGGTSNDHTFASIENVTGSSAEDTITGNSSANTILGSDGDDTIDGGDGADYLDGGFTDNGSAENSQSNTLSFLSLSEAVNVDLSTDSAISTVSAEQDTILNFSNIKGTDLSSQSDTLKGDENTNIIEGFAGNDTLEGLGGDDILDGGEGNDTFILSADDGEDTIDGGDGSGDTLDYSNLTLNQSINIELDTSTSKDVTITDNQGTDVDLSDDTTYTDHIVNIENVTGGAGDDSIIGDSNTNTFLGNEGDDYLDGAAGKDELYGGAGDDSLEGGTEADELYGEAGDDNLSGGSGLDIIDGGEADENTGDSIDYSGEVQSLDINLKQIGTDLAGYSTATVGGIKADYLKDIENIKGSTTDDYIGGDDDSNILQGHYGNDTIVGAGADDTLYGGKGDDIFKAGLDSNGDAILEDGDDGADTIDGDGGVGSGTGNDTVDYSAIAQSISVTLDGSNDATVTIDTYSNDIIKNIENVIGSSVDDIIIGDSGANVLDGSDGDDTLSGAGGNDTLIGGIGTDVADYSTAATAVTIDLSDTDGDGFETSDDGDGGQDSLDGIEIIIASSGDDLLTGDSLNNTFIGGDGYDKFYGTDGDDTFYSGSLDASGNYVDDGEFGKVDYDNDGNSPVGKVYIDLNTTYTDLDGNVYSQAYKSNSTANDNDYTDGTDRLYGITTARGTSSHDTIIGNSEGNKLQGEGGDDYFEGGDGDDSLEGGDGNDIFVATSITDGVDDIYGESGSDTIDYSAYSSANFITVNLGSSTVDVTGGDNDTFSSIENVIATQGADIVTGNAEINTLIGMEGADQLDGGDGADKLYGDNVANNFVAVLDGSNDDTLKGGAGNDELYGGKGDDTLQGGADDDILHGGDDIDTVDYRSASSAVTVDLALTTSQAVGGGEGNDTFIEIENVLGSSYADTFKSNFGADNSFDGGVADTNGGDTVDYSALNVDDATIDKIVTDLSTATVTSDSGTTLQNVTDTFIDIENIIASAGNDTLTGNASDNTLQGLAGDDIIEGGAGDDYLDGGTNTSVGDTVNYSTANEGVNVDLGIDGTSQNVSAGQGNDTFIGIENVIGSAYSDTFKSNTSVSNTFNGGTTDLSDATNPANEQASDENDTVDYSSLLNATDKIVVDLSNTSNNVSVTVSNVLQSPDTLINIENVTGSFGDDTFTGNSDSNIFLGGDGDDTFLITGASVGSESDTLDGGNNTSTGDTVDFSGVTDVNYFVDVDLASQDLYLKDNSASNIIVRDDTVLNIENITGTQNEDTIRGNSSANILKGESGTDSIYGNEGADIIYGGSNTDDVLTATTYEVLDGGADDDTIYGGTGNDSILGGTGVGEDTLYGEAGNDIIKGGSGIDIIDGGADDDTLKGDAGEDTIYGGLGDDEIEGGTEGDLIYGDDLSNTDTAGGDDILSGGDGTDTIYGGYGDDTLSGGSNDDDLYGGEGSDTVTYENSVNSVVVNLSTQTAVGEGNDTLGSIENAIGSAYDDTFISDFNASNIFDGNESLNEITGDSISYETIVVTDPTVDKVVINLSTEVGEVLIGDGYFEADVTYNNGVDSFTDYLINIENITGSTGNDTITGASDENKIYGLDGDDVLSGGADDDYLHGGAGNDTASYIEKTVSVTVDFINNTATTTTEIDTLESIENAIGGSAKDTFIMNEDNATNIIDGQGDEDTISYENYSSNGVTVNLSTILAQNIQTSDSDTLTSIEHITGSTKADTIIGSSDANSIVGGSGNDTFIAGTDINNDGTMDTWADDGADYIDGGDGTGDWADYSIIGDDSTVGTNGIEVTLDNSNEVTVNVNGQAGVDTLLNIENISGTQDSDSITGDALNNSILGNTGDDIISGEGGLDNLFGGAGNDTISGGAGNDTIIGGADDDTLTGDVGDDDIYGGTYDGTTHVDFGIDTVDYTDALEDLTINLDLNESDGATYIGLSDGFGGTQGQGDDNLYGIENVIGSNSSAVKDTIYGSAVSNVITSQAGDDYIEARDGDDTVIAGSGDDTIVATSANDGADYYDGGATGSDTLDYSVLNEDIIVDLSVAANTEFVSGSGTNDSWTVSITGGDNDIIKDIENFIGGAGDDTITMNSGVNQLEGGAGADTLSGNVGNDIIDGYYSGKDEATEEGAIQYDTVSYEYLTSKSVTLDLQLGTSFVDSNDEDTLISIENAI
ncbi:hypothetical protein OAR97_07085, partial [Arcobacteraceae bacterium]|nr:hypothetical protein [Arcobacteraceae bacterium]